MPLRLELCYYSIAMERRNQLRYEVNCTVDAVLPSVGTRSNDTIRGLLLNLSAGGACLLSDRPPEIFSVLPCRFHFASLPVAVPLLMQVRWIEPLAPGQQSFRIGLSFLT